MSASAWVEFRILGPLEIMVGPARLELGGIRQQTVLAALLLNANKVVAVDRLLEAVYADHLPSTSRAQLHISISSLRRIFAARCGAEVIATRAPGYVIRVDDGRLDSERFGELVAAARGAREDKKFDQAVAYYREALRLWRGPALDGIDSQLVQEAAYRLDEQRVTASEDCLKLELDLGRHRELVAELTQLVNEFPLRERLHGQLMLALYRSDRPAEALQVYQRARKIMVDELGIEPGEQLRLLEYAVLTSDPSLDLPTKPIEIQPVKHAAPCLLPADIADFTGREEQVEQISHHLLRSAEDQIRLAVPIVVITGKGGVGKTTIAVHVSHRLADQFADGQLYADLHGGTLHPASPMQVLERFLRALGVPGPRIPDGLDERAETYRGLVADRRVLVVLDDAASEGQVSVLLPGRATAAVIVTARRRLAGLPGATHVEIDAFKPGNSLDLLARITGVERAQKQHGAAAEIAGLCGHLPLALRIAGARLSARPHWSFREMVDRLTDETRRLDELRYGDLGIRANISLSYESIGEQSRQLFRRLALLELPVFSGWVSAALLDISFVRAQDLLDDLINAQLIEATATGSGLYGQYRFHDLIRVFARERLAAEEVSTERKSALARVLGGLLNLAEEAHRRQYGGDYVRLRSDVRTWALPGRLVEQLLRDPLLWYDRERVTLSWGVRQAAKAGFAELCWNLAISAVTLFETRVYLDDWRETHEIALETARQAQDVRGQAAMLYSTGSLYMIEQQFDLARQTFVRAIALFETAGDDQGIALVMRHIAFLNRMSGRLGEATEQYERALTIFRHNKDQVAVAYVLHGLAKVKAEFGQLGDAKELLREALQLSRAARNGRVEAQVLHRIGEVRLMAGEPARAANAFELALARVRDIGDPIGEAHALCGAGIARVRQGEYGGARRALRRALMLAGTVGERFAEAQTLLGLSELALTSGDPDQAIGAGQRASSLFQEIGIPLDEARAFALLSESYAARGDSAAAEAARAKALRLRAQFIGNVAPPRSGDC